MAINITEMSEYKEGKEAAYEGKKYPDCPYPSTQVRERIAWIKGNMSGVKEKQANVNNN